MMYSVVLDGQGYAAEVVAGFDSKQEAMEEAEYLEYDYVVRGTQMWNEPIGQIEESNRRARYWSVRRFASLKHASARLGKAQKILRPHLSKRSKGAGQWSVDERTITQDLSSIFPDVQGPRSTARGGSMWEIDMYPQYGASGIVDVYHFPDKHQITVSSDSGRKHIITTSDDEQVWPTLKRDMEEAYRLSQRNPDAPLAYFEAALMDSMAKDLQIARDPAHHSASAQKQARISNKMHRLIIEVDSVTMDLQNAVEAVTSALFRDRDLGDEEKAQAAQVLRDQLEIIMGDIQKTKRDLSRL